MALDCFETSLGYKTLVSIDDFKQCVVNIQEDTELDDGLKQKFFDYLKDYDGTTEIEDYCNSGFFWMNQLLSNTLIDKEFLGHCVALKGLINSLKNQDPFFDDKVFEDFINSNDLDELKDVFGTFDIKHVGIMWSFYSDDRKPFYSEPEMMKDLPCILGLFCPRGLKKIKYVVFEHYIVKGSLSVRKPTAFDAGLSNLWRPGGYTLPLDACILEYKNGLSEAVHETNIINAISILSHLEYEFN